MCILGTASRLWDEEVTGSSVQGEVTGSLGR